MKPATGVAEHPNIIAGITVGRNRVRQISAIHPPTLYNISSEDLLQFGIGRGDPCSRPAGCDESGRQCRSGRLTMETIRYAVVEGLRSVDFWACRTIDRNAEERSSGVRICVVLTSAGLPAAVLDATRSPVFLPSI